MTLSQCPLRLNASCALTFVPLVSLGCGSQLLLAPHFKLLRIGSGRSLCGNVVLSDPVLFLAWCPCVVSLCSCVAFMHWVCFCFRSGHPRCCVRVFRANVNFCLDREGMQVIRSRDITRTKKCTMHLNAMAWVQRWVHEAAPAHTSTHQQARAGHQAHSSNEQGRGGGGGSLDLEIFSGRWYQRYYKRCDAHVWMFNGVLMYGVMDVLYMFFL